MTEIEHKQLNLYSEKYSFAGTEWQILMNALNDFTVGQIICESKVVIKDTYCAIWMLNEIRHPCNQHQ